MGRLAVSAAAMRPAFWLLAAFLLLAQAEVFAQTSYRLDRSRRQITVDSRQHWESWHFPEGSVTIAPEGVQPRRWQLNTNATGEIVRFLRDNPPDYLAGKTPGEIRLLDAITAGSNREDVVNALDGDPATYWEPDPPQERSDLSASWWFRIDLGRIVVANRIVVTFVDEELGDPFYLFEVLTSDGQQPISARGGKSLDFLPVLQMVEPNTTRRRFEIDFTDAPKLRREMVVRFIQMVARGSRLDRGVEIDAAEYERLQQESPGTVGTVEYIKLGSGGREIAVSRENWERLPDETRGPVRHFRRERPRLAEIEVWEEGEDIARDLLDRGGSISSLPKIKSGPKGMFDGDIGTNFPAVWYVLDDAIRKPGIVADLGSFFWVKSVRIVQSLTGAIITFSLGNHQLDLSDGSKRVDGSLNWVTAKVVTQEVMAKQPREDDPNMAVSPTKSHVERHTLDTPIKARFVRLAYDRTPRPMHAAVYPITEWQVFGVGFQPQVTIASPLIDPRGTRTLTSIEWDAETPPGTRLFLQTRTSQIKAEVTRFFNGTGEEVTEEKYDKLQKPNDKVKIPDNLLQGDIVTEEIMGSDSSAWSDPYLVSGARITSPSPRKYVQVRATLLSDTPQAAATLKAVRLNYTDPLADGFLGELTPTQVESLAVERPFSLYIRPSFSSGNPGFDGILMTAPKGMSLGFSDLYAGSEADLLAAEGLDDLAVQAQPAPTGKDSLLVTFPLIGPGDGAELLRLDFFGELFSVGGIVQAFVRLGDGAGEVVWQQVDEGDAAARIGANSLVVVGMQSHRELFAGFEVPAAFSPNGDGVNDAADLGFTVLLVGRSRRVAVDIFDLRGRRVRTLEESRDVSAGSYSLKWNGEDDSGNLVPPGIYALRFHVDADGKGAGLDRREVFRTLAVAY